MRCTVLTQFFPEGTPVRYDINGMYSPTRPHLQLEYRRFRARRALTLFNDVPLRTRRALTP